MLIAYGVDRFAGGSLQHGFRVNPWGSQGAQLIDGSQGALPEPPKSSSRALCGLTKRPMQDPVVASDMYAHLLVIAINVPSVLEVQ